MKVRDLIELLEGLDEDLEVRLAHQPSWPLEYGISDVVECFPDDDGQPAGPAVVYLVEGGQLGYLPGFAAAQIGWNRR